MTGWKMDIGGDRGGLPGGSAELIGKFDVGTTGKGRQEPAEVAQNQWQTADTDPR